MGIFGWDLPPGCHKLPYDDDYLCEVCGLDVNKCICPECTICGEVGNKDCYDKHGLVRTSEQIESLKKLNDYLDAQDKWDEDLYISYKEDMDNT